MDIYLKNALKVFGEPQLKFNLEIQKEDAKDLIGKFKMDKFFKFVSQVYEFPSQWVKTSTMFLPRDNYNKLHIPAVREEGGWADHTSHYERFGKTPNKTYEKELSALTEFSDSKQLPDSNLPSNIKLPMHEFVFESNGEFGFTKNHYLDLGDMSLNIDLFDRFIDSN